MFSLIFIDGFDGLHYNVGFHLDKNEFVEFCDSEFEMK